MEEISQEELSAWQQFYEDSQLKVGSETEKILGDYYEQRKKEKHKRLEEFWTGTVIPAGLPITTNLLVSLLESRIYTCIEAGFPAWRFEELALFASLIEGSKAFSENGKMTLAEYFGMKEFISEEE